MRHTRAAARRPGFTLIEVLIALTLTAIIGAAITALFVTQERAFDTQTKLQSAREVTRGARNLLTSELRMLERDSGVVKASPDSITLRVPYAMGVACVQNASLIVNLLPVDSVMHAQGDSAYGGYALRNFGSGTYEYVASTGTRPAASAASACTAVLDTVPRGTVMALVPLPTGPAAVAGAPVLLWQVVRYVFAASQEVPGRRALYRHAPAVGQPEELLAPFADSAHFEFYVDDATTPVTTAPSDLSRLTGIELVLDALSERPRADGTHPIVRLRTAVFFKNRRI